MAKTPQVPALPGVTPLGIKPQAKKDWFDTHIEVIGVSDSFAEKVKAKLRLEVARKYGHKHGCECPFCRGAMIKLERDADE